MSAAPGTLKERRAYALKQEARGRREHGYCLRRIIALENQTRSELNRMMRAARKEAE